MYLLFSNEEDCIAANDKISKNKGFPVYAKDKNGNLRLNTEPTATWSTPRQDINGVWFIEKPDNEFMDGVIFASETESIALKKQEFDI